MICERERVWTIMKNVQLCFVFVCLHVSQFAWAGVSEGWMNTEIQWMHTLLLKMQSLCFGSNQKVLHWAHRRCVLAGIVFGLVSFSQTRSPPQNSGEIILPILQITFPLRIASRSRGLHWKSVGCVNLRSNWKEEIEKPRRWPWQQPTRSSCGLHGWQTIQFLMECQRCYTLQKGGQVNPALWPACARLVRANNLRLGWNWASFQVPTASFCKSNSLYELLRSHGLWHFWYTTTTMNTIVFFTVTTYKSNRTT